MELSDEIWMLIMKDLHILDLYSCKLTCKRLYDIVNHEYFKKIYKFEEYRNMLKNIDNFPNYLGYEYSPPDKLITAIYNDDIRMIKYLETLYRYEYDPLCFACDYFKPNIIKYYINTYIKDIGNIHKAIEYSIEHNNYLGLKEIYKYHIPNEKCMEEHYNYAINCRASNVLSLLFINRVYLGIEHFIIFKQYCYYKHDNYMMLCTGDCVIANPYYIQISNINDYLIKTE